MEKEKAFELAKHRALAVLALTKGSKVKSINHNYISGKDVKNRQDEVRTSWKTLSRIKSNFHWSKKEIQIVDSYYTRHKEGVVKLIFSKQENYTFDRNASIISERYTRRIDSFNEKFYSSQQELVYSIKNQFGDTLANDYIDIKTKNAFNKNKNKSYGCNNPFNYSFLKDTIRINSIKGKKDHESVALNGPLKQLENGLWLAFIESLYTSIVHYASKLDHLIKRKVEKYIDKHVPKQQKKDFKRNWNEKSETVINQKLQFEIDSVLITDQVSIKTDLQNITFTKGSRDYKDSSYLTLNSSFLDSIEMPVLKEEKEPSLPPILSIQNLTFSESLLEAQEKASLKITLKNTGAGKAQDVHVKLLSNMDEYLEYPRKKYFETIEKESGKATVTIPVKAKKNIPSGKAWMDIQVVEPNFHVNIQGKRLVFETQKFQAPNLVLAKFAAKESRAANPDQKIGINEQMKLKILPQNVGKQEAEDIKIQVKNKQKGVQFLGYGEGENLSMDNPEYPSIDFGDYKKLTANYFINSRFEADSLRFTIKGEEKYGEYGFSQTKTIPINNQVKAEGTIKKVKGPEGEKGDQEVKIKDLPSFGIDVEQNIPKTPANQPNTYALIIGNENYTKYQSSLSQESNVDFAKRDAEIFAKYVRKTLGVPPDNIRVKTNLTAATMKRQIEWLQTRSEYASDSIQLIFYYSGHGFPNPKTKEKYLMPVDVTGAQVTRGVDINKLYNQLTENKTKRATLFLDACFSGAGREQGLLAAKSVKIEPKENAIMDGKLVAFSSSQGDQQSFFYKQKKHGLFTYYLLKKLKQTKGEVTYGELYNYVKNKVPFQSTEIYGAEQVPGVKFSRAMKGEWKNWKIR